MNKLSFLIQFLVYAIVNPKKGIDIINAKYCIWHDSKTYPPKYDNKESDVSQVIKTLFPDTDFSSQNTEKNTRELQDHINRFFDELKLDAYPSKKKPYPISYTLDNKSGLFLYALCKIIQPEAVVETGVAYGLSSMYVLQALHENKKGTLYSIDSTFSPWQSKETIGSAIPDHLKDRWRFIFGSSYEELIKVLNSLKSIDIFIHDSLHTKKNMTCEFDTSWPFIRKGGFLISDDIGDNNAFYEFYTKMKVKPIILQQKESSFFGIIKK